MNSLTKLNNAYSKQLKWLNKHFYDYVDAGFVTFIMYLRYLRDSAILTNSMSNTAISTLITTIAEFEAYELSERKEEKEFHWNNFWEHIKLNVEEWLGLNDSV